MDPKDVITPDIEVKDVTTTEKNESNDSKQTVETVPLAVYLDLKEDMKALKKEIQSANSSDKEKTQIEGLENLVSKYSDVSPEFLQDILTSATAIATKKIDEKYTPIIEQQKQEQQKKAFDTEFDNLYNQVLEENPSIPKNIDKETIKELALTPKYRNVPLVEIMQKMYPEQVSAKSSSENDTRTSADRVEDIVNFSNITAEQKSAILDDEKSRTKYFAWLDQQVMR